MAWLEIHKMVWKFIYRELQQNEVSNCRETLFDVIYAVNVVVNVVEWNFLYLIVLHEV